MSSETDTGPGVRLPLPPGDEHPIQRAGRYGPDLVAAFEKQLHAVGHIARVIFPILSGNSSSIYDRRGRWLAS